MSRVKIKSRKNLIKTKLFDVDELLVSYADINDIFHGVYVKPAVVILPLNEKNELYLTRQYRHIKDKIYLELCSGMIELNEDPIKAAKRELAEELGLLASKWVKLPKVEIGSAIFDWDFHFYTALNLKLTEQKLDLSEDIEVIKIPLSKAVMKVYSGEIVKLTSIAGILMLYNMQGIGSIKI